MRTTNFYRRIDSLDGIRGLGNDSAHEANHKKLSNERIRTGLRNLGLVHSSIHPLCRHPEGYTPELIQSGIQNSNGLNFMTLQLWSDSYG